MNRWSKAATRGALAGARSAVPVFGIAKLVANAVVSRERATKRSAAEVGIQVAAGAAIGAGFALLRERFSVPEAVVVGVGLGAATWALGRLIARSEAPSLPTCIAFGTAVERSTRAGKEGLPRGKFAH
ncbi:hypothetical protein BH09MYX1_BH09MYX1_50290 [soil metagenome]